MKNKASIFIKLVILPHNGFIILCLCGAGATVLHIFTDTPLVIVHIPKRKS